MNNDERVYGNGPGTYGGMEQSSSSTEQNRASMHAMTKYVRTGKHNGKQMIDTKGKEPKKDYVYVDMLNPSQTREQLEGKIPVFAKEQTKHSKLPLMCPLRKYELPVGAEAPVIRAIDSVLPPWAVTVEKNIPHPVAAVTRVFLRDAAMQQAVRQFFLYGPWAAFEGQTSARIVDVGGIPTNWSHMNHSVVHCVNPINTPTPTDAKRRTACNCIIQMCTHIRRREPGGKPTCVTISSHSLYHLSPHDLVELMVTTHDEHYAVVHRVTEDVLPVGSPDRVYIEPMCEIQAYESGNSDSMVHCTADGNRVAYTHKRNDWMFVNGNTYSVTVGGLVVERVLFVEKLTERNGQYLLKFTIREPKGPFKTTLIEPIKPTVSPSQLKRGKRRVNKIIANNTALTQRGEASTQPMLLRLITSDAERNNDTRVFVDGLTEHDETALASYVAGVYQEQLLAEKNHLERLEPNLHMAKSANAYVKSVSTLNPIDVKWNWALGVLAWTMVLILVLAGFTLHEEHDKCHAYEIAPLSLKEVMTHSLVNTKVKMVTNLLNGVYNYLGYCDPGGYKRQVIERIVDKTAVPAICVGLLSLVVNVSRAYKRLTDWVAGYAPSPIGVQFVAAIAVPLIGCCLAWQQYYMYAAFVYCMPVIVALALTGLGAQLNVLWAIRSDSMECPAIPFVCSSAELAPQERGTKLKTFVQEGTASTVLCRDNTRMNPAWPDRTTCHGTGVYGYLPAFPKPCYHNTLIAVRNRCVFDRLLRVNKHLNSLGIRPIGAIEPFWRLDTSQNKTTLNRGFDGWRLMDQEEWLDRYPKTRQRELIDTTRREVTQPGLYAKHGNAKSFIKKEPYFGKINPEPRLIQGSSGIHNVRIGPTVVSLSTRFAQNFNYTHPRFFYASKTTPTEIGSWFAQCCRDGFNFYMNDYSRFDATISESMLAWEREMYVEAKASTEFAKEFRKQFNYKGVVNYKARHLNGRGTTREQVYYTSIGGRRSGVPNTSLGNTLINFRVIESFMNMYYPGIDYRCMALGDDLVVAIKGDVQPRLFSRFAATFGLMAKFSLCSPQEVEFCSSIFYPVEPIDGYATFGGCSYVLGPKIGRVIAKTFWSKDGLKPSQGKIWAYEVAVCIHRNSHYVPVLGEILRAMINQLADARRNLRMEGRTRKIIEDYYSESVHSVTRCGADVRANGQTLKFVAERYGMTAAEIQACCQDAANTTFPTVFVDRGRPTSASSGLRVGAFASAISTMARKDVGGCEYLNTENLYKVREDCPWAHWTTAFSPAMEEIAIWLCPDSYYLDVLMLLMLIVTECIIYGQRFYGLNWKRDLFIFLGHFVCYYAAREWGVIVGILVHHAINYVSMLAPGRNSILLNLISCFQQKQMYDWFKVKQATKNQEKTDSKNGKTISEPDAAASHIRTYKQPGKGPKLVRPGTQSGSRNRNLVQTRLGRNRPNRNHGGRNGAARTRGNGRHDDATAVVSMKPGANRNAGAKRRKPHVVKILRNGVSVGRVHVHPAKGDYDHAVKGMFSGAPLAYGYDYPRTETHETTNGTNTSIAVSQFLCDVIVPDGTYTYQGQTMAVIPIMAETLGGRIAVLAKQFAESKLRRIHLRYLPGQPTTTPGSIVIGCLTDVAEDIYISNDDSLARLSSTDGFHGTPAWENSEWSLPVQHFAKRVFDEATGDIRMSAEGVVLVLAGSGFDTLGNLPLGSLYITAEMEFYSPTMQPIVNATPTVTPCVFKTGGAFTANSGDPVTGTTDSTPAGTQISFLLGDTGGLQPTAGVIYCVWTGNYSAADYGGNALTLKWVAAGEDEYATTTRGASAFYVTVFQADGSFPLFAVSNNLTAVTDLPTELPIDTEAVSPPGTLIWSITGPPVDTGSTFACWCYPVAYF
jgi:hypothetical protein